MEIKLSHEQVIEMAQEALPKLLKEVFEKTYSNPLKDALEAVLKEEAFKEELKKIILETYTVVSKEVDFKLFVREAVVAGVIKQLQKN